MAETQHTPGPWYLKVHKDAPQWRYTIRHKKSAYVDIQIAELNPYLNSIGNTQDGHPIANGNLIAAAPDGLDLAQFVQAWFEEAGRGLDAGEQVLLDKANELIAKATGQ